ncbi:MAG: hypothetical protein RLZZ227_1032 [Pseudomonadota bacterium]|jgi:iron complex transport system substrate-binding protein
MIRSSLPYLLCAVLAAPVFAQEPQRIVSMNLCTDQLLLLLVERERIASVSYFAANPDYSALAAEARGIPPNRGQAEEVLAFAPDLILTSQFSATLAANLLERLEHPVARLGFAATADEVYAQIHEVAALTGTTQKAQRLVADIQRSIEVQRQSLLPSLQGKSAAFFMGNGVSYGSNSLQHDFLTSVGLRNVAADAGLSGPAMLSLEVLIAAAPDYLFIDRRSMVDAQLAHPMLQHPALAQMARHTRIVELPDTLFQCAGPQLADAYRLLSMQVGEASANAR